MGTSNSLQYFIWLTQNSKDIFSGSKCKVTFGFKYMITLIHYESLVREPVIRLMKWLRPKGLKVCSYVEKCA